MTPVRVVLADDHALVRAGIRALLGGIAGVEVVGEAQDGHEIIQLVEKLRPRLVLMDIAMPGLNGLEATARIVKSHPGTAVIILSMHAGEEYALQALKAGASGYLLKDGAASELLAGIRALKAGKTFFGPHATKALAEAFARDRPAEPADPYERLTDREREVFQLVVEGKTNPEIGGILFISAKTVDNHRTRLMEKLGLHSTAELVRFAARHKLLG